MMRHLADRTKSPPTQKTANAVEGNQTSSPPWSARLCLPVLSKDKRVMWVHANEVDMQPDTVEELDQAFSRSPYLTPKQTAALAQRCSLHPDQVRVWFMAQRLLCGVSWDYEDIREICNKLISNNEDEELTGRFKEEQVKNKDQKREGRECGGEVNRNGAGKQRRGSKRCKKQDDERITDGTKMEPVLTKKRRAKTKLISSGAERQTDQQEETMNPPPTSGSRPEETQEAALCPQSNVKTQRQLLMLKKAFLQSQYPTAQQYSSLARIVSINRTSLIKWFVNSRYYVKKWRPGWMTVQQHKEVKANIMYQQYKKWLKKQERREAAERIERDTE